MKKIVIFASGTGSNFENIVHYFKNNGTIGITGLFCNNENAMVVKKATDNLIPVVNFQKSDISTPAFLSKLQAFTPDLIILAGFLLKLPSEIIVQFPNKIVNIHPSLLPKFGGKGMYGNHVHQAVLDNKETETGITIHYVTENYDEGAVIFQKSVSILGCNTVDAVAEKVHELELEFFPKVIEQILLDTI